MMISSTKTRFAPSPSGFLHIGNARMALFCALLARRADGIFLLRIEDTDRERSSAHYVQALEEDLLWLGLDWQEGPGIGGNHGPYAQSERGAIYDEYFVALEASAQAYPCFCSEQELALARKTQLASGKAPRYAGTCAALSTAQIESKAVLGLKPTLRFRVPRGEVIEFDDLVRGPQRMNSDDIGDFIIRRGDGTPAFFFSNAIDDALMQVTHALRGEDHLTNTPRQLLLFRALGLCVPRYGHVPLIVGADGAPLSKRHGSCSVRDLRAEGYLAGAVTHYLAQLGHHYERNDFMNFDELAAGFAAENIGRAPARYDDAQLRHWQHEAIARASLEDLWNWVGAEIRDEVPEHDRAAFMEAIRRNITLPPQALFWARILYRDPLEMSTAAREAIVQAGPDFFAAARAALDHHGTDFKALANALKDTLGVSKKALFQPLRAALTGELDGPEMARLLPLLGIERARARLLAAA